MGRFKDLYKNTDGWYSPSCPVIILAGALLQDTEDNSLIAQLKLRNIGNKNIVCCKVSLKTFEVNGKECEEITDFSYLDLNIALNGEFGVQTPIKLTSNLARRFVASVSEIVYSDSKVVRYDEKWTSIPSSIPLDAHLKHAEQVKQFQLECGDNYRFLPQKIGGLFLCACDTLNQGEESKCTSCGRRYSYFEPKLDIEYLNRLIEERQEKERLEKEKKEQERLENETKRKEKLDKAKKTAIEISIIIAILAVIITAIYFAVTKFIPDYKYNKAVELHNQGNYDEAIVAFTDLNGYRDSENQIIVCQYDKAMNLIAIGDYDSGYQLLRTVGLYYDAEAIITSTEYSRGIQCIENADYQNAISFFEYSIDYEDSQEKIYQCHFELGRLALENEDLDLAVEEFIAANHFGEADDYLSQTYDLKGDVEFNNSNFEEAMAFYELSDNSSQISECYFNLAELAYTEGDYLTAGQYYEEVTTHSDSGTLAQDAYYNYVSEAYLVEDESVSYYNSLIIILNKLDEEIYTDVSSMILDTKYNKANALYNQGDYDDAVDAFEEISDYRDSSSRIKEAKYQYIITHRNSYDTTTYEYLCDLIAIGYSDTRTIYSDLYAWEAEVKPVSGSNSNTRVYSFSRYDNFYFLIELSGGPPDWSAETTIRATFTYPNGSTSTVNWGTDEEWSDGSYAHCWFYYTNPYYGSTGTGTLRVYDSNGNRIGEASVEIY